MKKNGFITIEAILVFPVVVMVISLFIYLIIMVTVIPDTINQLTYMDEINMIDSNYRKVGILHDVFK